MDDLNQTFELLNSGRIDATLNAEVTFYDYTQRASRRQRQDRSPDPGRQRRLLSRCARATRPPPCVRLLTTAIDELRASGQLKDLSEKYFGTDISSND